MRTRYLRKTDIPKLKALFEKSGFAYQFPELEGPLIESVIVIVDENDEPIMAAAAERITQLYLWCGDMHPAAKIAGIRILHEEMAEDLKAKGYSETNCFIPPELAKSFGRRLENTFQWARNWPSWCKRF